MEKLESYIYEDLAKKINEIIDYITMTNKIKQEECRHEFWKDRNPPYCINCGKTEKELFNEKFELKEGFVGNCKEHNEDIRKCDECFEPKETLGGWEEKWNNLISDVGFRSMNGEKVDIKKETTEFIRTLLAQQKAQIKKELMSLVERLKLECDVVVCDCGEKVSEWDIANYVKELKSKLEKI